MTTTTNASHQQPAPSGEFVRQLEIFGAGLDAISLAVRDGRADPVLASDSLQSAARLHRQSRELLNSALDEAGEERRQNLYQKSLAKLRAANVYFEPENYLAEAA